MVQAAAPAEETAVAETTGMTYDEVCEYVTTKYGYAPHQFIDNGSNNICYYYIVAHNTLGVPRDPIADLQELNRIFTIERGYSTFSDSGERLEFVPAADGGSWSGMYANYTAS